jgi:hypothetical protein
MCGRPTWKSVSSAPVNRKSTAHTPAASSAGPIVHHLGPPPPRLSKNERPQPERLRPWGFGGVYRDGPVPSHPNSRTKRATLSRSTLSRGTVSVMTIIPAKGSLRRNAKIQRPRCCSIAAITRCSHHVEISADRWPDHMRLPDIEPRFVCTACGKRGADIRPNFEPARTCIG